MLGCTNPAAKNYNPAATEDNGTCQFVNKIGNVCYAFEPVVMEGVEDRSFTLSWSIEGDNWVFYHDYVPDFYFDTRERLFSLKDSKIWKHHEGPMGTYYDGTKPFFIDVVFNNEDEMTLNSVSWLTEALTQSGVIEEMTTLTHVTIWNSYQCSGKIAMPQFTPLPATGKRKLASEYSFNEFRDILIDRVGGFMEDIFKNKDVKDGVVDPDQPWYDQRLFEDKYFVVRFEFDNTGNKSLSLHAVDIDANQSTR